MSYCKHPLGPVPGDIAKIGRGFKKNGKRFLDIATLVESLFDESEIQAAYPKAGQWGIHPVRMLILMLLQASEGLSDRQAAEASGVNLGWKLVLRLPIDHAGYDASVLSEFRLKLLQVDATKVYLDVILQKAKEMGLLNVEKQRTDSTSIEACVKSLNRTELILEAVRNVLEELAAESPEWVFGIARPTWIKKYYLDRPFDYRLPKKESERVKLANGAAEDGRYLLEKMKEQKRQDLESLPSVKTLRTILEQQFTDNDKGSPELKDAKDLPPASERLLSPYESDARVGMKEGKATIGYKAHITETCTPNFPRLITQIRVEPATLNDSLSFTSLMEDLCKRGMKPKEVLIDGGYVNVDEFFKVETELGIKPISRLSNGHSWQSQQGGFDQSHFKIDWKRAVVKCPNGAKSSKWKVKKDGHIDVMFSNTDCSGCPLRQQCTKTSARMLRLKPRPIYEYMQRLRSWQESSEFKNQYSIRSGIEATNSQLISRNGRRTTVKGKEKVSLKLLLSVVAHNLARMVDYIQGKAISATRRGKFERLMSETALLAV